MFQAQTFAGSGVISQDGWVGFGTWIRPVDPGSACSAGLFSSVRWGRPVLHELCLGFLFIYLIFTVVLLPMGTLSF